MDSNLFDEVLNEVSSALESAETQSGAILQFLKDKNLATDEDLAPYLERAGNASNVRWRAARLRINSLLASAMRSAEEELTRKVQQAVQADQNQKADLEKGEGRDKAANQQEVANQDEVANQENVASTGKLTNKGRPRESIEEVETRKQPAAKANTEKPSDTEAEQPTANQDNPDQKVA